MDWAWALICAAVIVVILYGIVSSKLGERRQRKARERSLPFLDDTPRTGVVYDVHLSDGRKFLAVQLLGTSRTESGPLAIGGPDGLLVLRKPSGKLVFVRQASVRCLEEA
jgi:hypothetical protein